jgi:hypothetical protein
VPRITPAMRLLQPPAGSIISGDELGISISVSILAFRMPVPGPTWPTRPRTWPPEIVIISRNRPRRPRWSAFLPPSLRRRTANPTCDWRADGHEMSWREERRPQARDSWQSGKLAP